MEACSTAKTPEEREQCFLNFGLSARQVDRYYEPVMKMEEAIVEPASESEEGWRACMWELTGICRSGGGRCC